LFFFAPAKFFNTIPFIISPDAASPSKRKAWVRLIGKIYEVDPFTCPQCKGAMKIIKKCKKVNLMIACLTVIRLTAYAGR